MEGVCYRCCPSSVLAILFVAPDVRPQRVRLQKRRPASRQSHGVGVYKQHRNEAGCAIGPTLPNQERGPLPRERPKCRGFHPGDRIGIRRISRLSGREKGVAAQFSFAMVGRKITADFSSYSALYPSYSKISERAEPRVRDQAINRVRTALSPSIEKRPFDTRSAAPL